jgi:hypothetical protein
MRLRPRLDTDSCRTIYRARFRKRAAPANDRATSMPLLPKSTFYARASDCSMRTNARSYTVAQGGWV